MLLNTYYGALQYQTQAGIWECRATNRVLQGTCTETTIMERIVQRHTEAYTYQRYAYAAILHWLFADKTAAS